MMILLFWIGVKLSMPPLYFIILYVCFLWKVMDD